LRALFFRPVFDCGRAGQNAVPRSEENACGSFLQPPGVQSDEWKESRPSMKFQPGGWRAQGSPGSPAPPGRCGRTCPRAGPAVRKPADGRAIRTIRTSSPPSGGCISRRRLAPGMPGWGGDGQRDAAAPQPGGISRLSRVRADVPVSTSISSGLHWCKGRFAARHGGAYARMRFSRAPRTGGPFSGKIAHAGKKPTSFFRNRCLFFNVR